MGTVNPACELWHLFDYTKRMIDKPHGGQFNWGDAHPGNSQRELPQN